MARTYFFAPTAKCNALIAPGPKRPKGVPDLRHFYWDKKTEQIRKLWPESWNPGFLVDDQVTLAAAGDGSDPQRAVGIASLDSIAGRLLGASVEPPVENEEYASWYQQAVAGHFSAPDASETYTFGPTKRSLGIARRFL